MRILQRFIPIWCVESVLEKATEYKAQPQLTKTDISVK